MSPQFIASTIAVGISAALLAVSVGYAIGFANGHRAAMKKQQVRPFVVYTSACETPLRVSLP
jgi:hypothetical protein